ncbi:extracellular solute-binding protein [bacterium]|nr:extracellular solute-binding protein [bacterium]
MRRYIIFILIALFLLSCGKREKGKTITIWHQMQIEAREVLERACEEYSAAHPDLKIVTLYKETEELRSAFQTASLAGGGPEIVYGPSDQIGPFSRMKLILPLEGLFSTDSLEKFDKMSLTYFEGHLYQIGDRIGNHLALVYNKALVPEPPKETDELIRLGKQLTKDIDGDGRTDRYALVWNYTEPYFFIPFLGGFGGWVMDENARPTLNTKATVSALRFIVALRDSFAIIPKECDYDMADALFKEGRAGMIINGPWSWGGYIRSGLDIGIACIPKVSETGIWPTPMVSPKGYSINRNTKSDILPDVVNLIYYLTSPSVELEFTKVLGTIPSRLEAQKDSVVVNNPIISASKEQLARGRLMPVVPELRAIWDAMRPAYQAVLGGAMTPEEAARMMQEEAEKKIKEMNE